MGNIGGYLAAAFIPPEMKQILWLAGRRFEFEPVFYSGFHRGLKRISDVSR